LLELAAGQTEKHVLFDTNSASEPILHNLKIFGKSLNRVTTIFLSPCHYDHTDGLPGILDSVQRPIPVVAHPEIFRPCFEINSDESGTLASSAPAGLSLRRRARSSPYPVCLSR